MKSEYYLVIAILGILIMAFGLFGILKNSHKKITEERTVTHIGDAVGTKDLSKYPQTIVGTEELKNVKNGNNSCFSYLCPYCGKIHTICQMGNISYFISPCNGEEIKIGH
jgi:hypothetical protein